MEIFIILTVLFLVLWLTSKKESQTRHRRPFCCKSKRGRNSNTIQSLRQDLDISKSSERKYKEENHTLQKEITAEKAHVNALSKYQQIIDAEVEAKGIISTAKLNAERIVNNANARFSAANAAASHIITDHE